MTKSEQTRLWTWRFKVLQRAGESSRNVAQTCRHFGISRQAFYKWKKRFDIRGAAGLEGAGARVTTLASANELPTAMQTTVPDVLLADVGMPGSDGFELIRRIRCWPDLAIRDVPAATLTAYARSEDRTRSVRAGFQLHLAMPIDPSELVTAVAALSTPHISA